MKAFQWLLLIAVCAWADEAADRLAIARVIAALNQVPPRTELFTPDTDAPAVLERLRQGKRVAYRPIQSSGHPTVTVSHEPWGEATIDLRGPGVEIVDPKIVSRAIRFITPEVALADGASTYREDGIDVETTPLLFVMKKEGDRWKVASIRVLR